MPRGRPKLSVAEITERQEEVLQKLEPFLKSGMSIKQAYYDNENAIPCCKTN